MSSKCYDYLAHIGEILEKVKTTQWDSIEKSAKKMAETIAAGHSVYIFGASHAGILAQEMFYRTGGLAVVNAILPSEFMLNTRPVTQTSAMERLEGYRAAFMRKLRWLFPEFRYMCAIYPFLEKLPVLLPVYWVREFYSWQ